MRQKLGQLRAARVVAHVPTKGVAVRSLALELELRTPVWIALKRLRAACELATQDFEPKARRVDANVREA